jgi:hypothetical protein
VLILDQKPEWMEADEWSRGTPSRGSRLSKYSMRKSNKSGSRISKGGGMYADEDERKSMLQA